MDVLAARRGARRRRRTVAAGGGAGRAAGPVYARSSGSRRSAGRRRCGRAARCATCCATRCATAAASGLCQGGADRRTRNPHQHCGHSRGQDRLLVEFHAELLNLDNCWRGYWRFGQLAVGLGISASSVLMPGSGLQARTPSNPPAPITESLTAACYKFGPANGHKAIRAGSSGTLMFHRGPASVLARADGFGMEQQGSGDIQS
jgi:hypothetical protein